MILASVQTPDDYAATSTGDVLFAVLALLIICACIAVPAVLSAIKANRTIRDAPRVFTDEDRRNAQ